jgi:hypothetical protein
VAPPAKKKPLERKTTAVVSVPSSSMSLSRHSERLSATHDVRTKVEDIRRFARSKGFDSFFSLAMYDVDNELNNDDLAEFVESGGLATVCEAYSRRFRKPRTAGLNTSAMNESLCLPAVHIYRREWAKLTEDPSLKTKAADFDPDELENFSYTSLRNKFTHHIPNLLKLFETLMPVGNCESRNRAAQDRYMVTAVAVMAKFSKRFSLLQHPMGIYLYGSRVSVQVISALNHLGLCSSYKSIIKSLKVCAVKKLSQLRTICDSGEAVWVSFDNVNVKTGVRDLRINHGSTMLNYTAGYAVRPHSGIAQPALSPSDRNFDKLDELRIDDFIPTDEHRDLIVQAFRWMIWVAFEEFAKKVAEKYPSCEYLYPEKYKLDHKLRSEVWPLATMDLNEAVINDVIQILRNIAKQIGLTLEQMLEWLVVHKGDLATVYTVR